VDILKELLEYKLGTLRL